MTKFDNDTQANKTMQLAFGRILNLGSSPFKKGDIEKYEKAKSVFLDGADYLGITPKDTMPNFVADYHKIYHD